MRRRVEWCFLGSVPYDDGVRLQEGVRLAVKDGEGPERLLLLEHPPVFTLGRNAGDGEVTADAEWLAERGIAVRETDRGGQATYHGPGQLMGYPIIDLRRCGQDLHKYLRWLEQLLIDLLADYDIAGQRRESLTGVWVENRKIASIGVGVRHWVTMHGFALNVCGDLSPFDHIVPCGIKNVAITSMEKETKKSFTVAEVARAVEKLARRRISDLRIDSTVSAVDAPCFRA